MLTIGALASHPRRQQWLLTAACLAVIVAGVLVLHHEVVLGGDVYHMEDAADGYYPIRTASARTMMAGHLPVWERGASTGWPINVDPYHGPFYPLNLIFHLAGMVRGLGFSIAFHMLLAGVGMFWLLRRRGLDFGSGLARGWNRWPSRRSWWCASATSSFPS